MFERRDIPEARRAIAHLLHSMNLVDFEPVLMQRLKCGVHHDVVMDLGNKICRLADEIERRNRDDR